MSTFTRKNYHREKFASLELSEESAADVTFESCSFENCTFITCAFERCHFMNCSFSGCALSAVIPARSRLDDIAFTDCKVIGIDWSRALETTRLRFTRCQLNYSNFRYLKMPGLSLVDCEVKEADFIGTGLRKAVFKGTDLAGSRFLKADLTEADFREAINYAIDPESNTLKKTRFSLPDVIGLLGKYDIVIE